MAANTSSTTEANGSADELAPSSTSPPPRTPAQVEDDAALATRRCVAFTDDTSLPVLTVPYVDSHPNTIASRTEKVAARIAAFDAAFDKGNSNNSNNGNNEDNGGHGDNK